MIDSMCELAEVVTTALYQTTVNSSTGDLTVNGVENEDNIVINEALDVKENYKTGLMVTTIIIVLSATACVYLFFVIYYNLRKKNKKI